MTDSIYLEKRTIEKLDDHLNKTVVQDRAFVSDRIDDSTMQDCSFQHTTFANISFKDTKILKTKFLNCVFINCYFRKSKLTESNFIGCKFIECGFPKIIINCCTFDYSSFFNCFIAFQEIEYSLPGAPNLREEITRNLSVESAKLGFFDESSRYRKEELNAKEKNLWAAFKGKSQWYRDHYNCCRQIKALFEYIISVLNGFLFGYGQYFYPLMRTLILSILFFWGLFFAFRVQITNQETGQPPTGLETFFYSLRNILPSGIDIKLQATTDLIRFLSAIEALWGLIIATYVASYIIRWSFNK